MMELGNLEDSTQVTGCGERRGIKVCVEQGLPIGSEEEIHLTSEASKTLKCIHIQPDLVPGTCHDTTETMLPRSLQHSDNSLPLFSHHVSFHISHLGVSALRHPSGILRWNLRRELQVALSQVPGPLDLSGSRSTLHVRTVELRR